MNILDNLFMLCVRFYSCPVRDEYEERRTLHEPGIPDPRAAQEGQQARPPRLSQERPKSYKRGQGALLNALVDNDGTTQRELVKILGLNRSELKDIVKKAERNGYVTIEDAEGERTYAVKLTDEVARSLKARRRERQDG